jgi:hypothetical protein
VPSSAINDYVGLGQRKVVHGTYIIQWSKIDASSGVAVLLFYRDDGKDPCRILHRSNEPVVESSVDHLTGRQR